MPDAEELNRTIRDVWQKVPKEEQVDIKTFAQSKGIEMCFTIFAFSTTTAIALEMRWLFFAGLSLIPLVYQVITAKIWRNLKIKTNLQYLVASTTAQRYAKMVNAKDLTLKMIFKGSLSSWKHAESSTVSEEDDAQPPTVDVWVCLFPGDLIMLSEGNKGAKLQLAHALLSDFRVFSETGEETHSSRKKLFLDTPNEHGETVRHALSARHTTTLVAFEKKIRLLAEQQRQQHEAQVQPHPKEQEKGPQERRARPILGIEPPNSEDVSTSMPA